MACTATSAEASDISKHIIPHASLHGIRLTVLVLYTRSTALAGVLLETLAELGVFLGDGFSPLRFGMVAAVVGVGRALGFRG